MTGVGCKDKDCCFEKTWSKVKWKTIKWKTTEHIFKKLNSKIQIHFTTMLTGFYTVIAQ